MFHVQRLWSLDAYVWGFAGANAHNRNHASGCLRDKTWAGCGGAVDGRGNGEFPENYKHWVLNLLPYLACLAESDALPMLG